MMRDLVRQYHPHLVEARIALAWQDGIKADKDDHLMLGNCRKASDLNRELAEWDFVIVLNREAWNDFGDKQRLVLLDHELMHAADDCDEDGEQKQDERGRLVWRMRGHDIEEFHDIVKRHGAWKKDLETFAKALAEKAKAPLFSGIEAKEGG